MGTAMDSGGPHMAYLALSSQAPLHDRATELSQLQTLLEVDGSLGRDEGCSLRFESTYALRIVGVRARPRGTGGSSQRGWAYAALTGAGCRHVSGKTPPTRSRSALMAAVGSGVGWLDTRAGRPVYRYFSRLPAVG